MHIAMLVIVLIQISNDNCVSRAEREHRESSFSTTNSRERH